ncbi:hypothetical protein OF83DRAFT_1124479 [Amylostereum chailletii]|nr:hypothetical protein OF83DRAFT_1124479 [Amylostereum chailletii]
MDKTIRVWDVGTEMERTRSMERREDMVASTALAQDGQSAKIDADALGFSAVGQDGWVKDRNGNLLFWVPPVHRRALYRPNTVLIIGENATQLDFDNFVHGDEWTACYTGDDRAW